MSKMDKPAIVSNAHLEYLDDLRDSGDTNMYGAPAHLEKEFNVTRQEAREILGYWMKTFGDRHG